MSAHRASYRKTIWATTAAALAAGGVIEQLLRAVIVSRAHWTPLIWMVWSIALALAVMGELAAGLVLAGGLVSLRRDALEQLGRPYAARRPRETTPNALVSALRRLFGRRGLRAGERVRIRPLDQILATLDRDGKTAGLPFMPEMAPFCGREARVFRRADKIYDWVQRTGLRRGRDIVLLEKLRCDGASHGGCQANCLVLWNEAWLERADARARPSPTPQPGLRLADLERLSGRRDAASGEARFVCQMTELYKATTPLSWGDPRHYVRDLLNGNVRLGPWLVGVSLAAFNAVQRRRGGVLFPMREGRAAKSPHAVLHLQPGELVRIKSKHDIEATLNDTLKNRGLWFDADMLRFCGGRHRVLARVDQLIEERSGKMLKIANPCIVLDGVTATGEYQAFAPLAERIYWREIWLERAAPAAPTPAEEAHESVAR